MPTVIQLMVVLVVLVARAGVRETWSKLGRAGEKWGEVGRAGGKWGEVGSPNSRCSFRDAKASWDLAIKGQGPLPYYK